MSDPDRRDVPPASGAGRPSAARHSESPHGNTMSEGAIAVTKEESAFTVNLTNSAIDQLLLRIEERIAEPRRKSEIAFGELAAGWLKNVRRVLIKDEQRNAEQLRPLWPLKEPELTAARIKDWFDHLLEVGFSPVSINKYRCAGKLIVRWAQSEGRWGPINPFDLVRRLKEPKRQGEMLTLGEIARVLPKLELDKRRMARVAFFLGLRLGELVALRKEDVDFNTRTVIIRRSHKRNSTKTGNERTLPLLGAVAADLIDAMAESQCDLVFPGPNGTQWRGDAKFSRALRTAMAKAGIVTGYAFHCRHPGCSYEMEFAGHCTESLCPNDGWKLWKNPVVRKVRWYDFRHAAATYHQAAGADPRAVAVLLGHETNITSDVYTHRGIEWLRAELSKLSLR